uniref:Uncharacterized protein n=1 Tax=Rhizophora mucronata TaxID=61149 RepID=A0A2P2QF38_RHIMU
MFCLYLMNLMYKCLHFLKLPIALSFQLGEMTNKLDETLVLSVYP